MSMVLVQSPNPTIELSDDQRAALDAALSGANVFITGEPGTGKSTLVDKIVAELDQQGKRAVLAAPTGIAALNISGITIHRLFGFPIRPMTRAIGGSCGKRDKLTQLMDAVDIVVVDEVSMVRSDVLEAMDAALQAAMGTKERFGGKQMIFVGDFKQLPPVVKPSEARWLQKTHGGIKAFQTQAWNDADIQKHRLTTVHRQKGDLSFVDVLRHVRSKTEGTARLVNSMVQTSRTFDDDATVIAFTNATCDEINDERLERLDAEPYVHHAHSFGNIGRQKPAPETLMLKSGARVMMVANDQDFRYVNGDIATVVEPIARSDKGHTVVRVELHRTGETIDVYRFEWAQSDYKVGRDGGLFAETSGQYKQFPMKLAWAITAHKSQGQTLDKVHLLMDTEPFSDGQMYVAMSRVRSADTLTLGRPVTDRDFFIGRAS